MTMLEDDEWMQTVLRKVAVSDFAKKYLTDNTYSLLPLFNFANNVVKIHIGYTSATPPGALTLENEVHPPFAIVEAEYPSKIFQVSMLTDEQYSKNYSDVKTEDSLIDNKLLAALSVNSAELNDFDYYKCVSRILARGWVTNENDEQFALKQASAKELLSYFKNVPESLHKFYAKEGKFLYDWVKRYF